MLKKYFKIAWKNILKSKGLNIINILGLALGISACLAIWFILRFEMSYDNFHPDKDRIFRLVSEFHDKTGEIRYNGTVPEPAAKQARLELTGMETIANFQNYNATVSIEKPLGEIKKFRNVAGAQDNNQLVFAEPQYFEIFQYQWIAGNPATALKEPFQVVLSAKQALKYFGSSDYENLVGKQVIYDDSLKTTVTGIVKQPDGNTDFSFTDFISYSTISTSFLKNKMAVDNWGMFFSSLQTFTKLEKEMTADRLEKDLQTFAGRHFIPDTERTIKVRLQPLSDLHYSQIYAKDYGRQADLNTLYGLLGIAIIILIIAAINFINLSLAQSMRRAREVGVRKVLGSSRSGLIIQFLTETFVMVLLAVVISMIIIKPILSSFPSFVPEELSISILDPVTISFILLILFITTILSGLYPGWVLSSFKPANVLKSKIGTSGGMKGGLRDNFRKGLVVFQFAISLIFIISSIIIGNQINFMLKKDMGFTTDAIITFNAGGRNSVNKKLSFAERLRTLSDVDKVSMHDLPPAATGRQMMSCTYLGAPPVEIEANFRHADENYVPLYRMKLMAGRNFFASDTGRGLLINETCAKMLGFRNPEEIIGRRIATMTEISPVIGVVSDFNLGPLNQKIGPVVIVSNPKYENAYSIKLMTRGKQIDNFKKSMAGIEAVWRETFPERPFEYNFYDASIANFYNKEQKTSQLVNLAMSIAILISCVGLFALAALTAENRKKEIGIRKVMGASTLWLTYFIVKDFLKLVFLSFIVASPVAWIFANQWLQTYHYRVPISWWVFVLAGITAMLIALLTVGYHVIRTAITKPAKTLRMD